MSRRILAAGLLAALSFSSTGCNGYILHCIFGRPYGCGDYGYGAPAYYGGGGGVPCTNCAGPPAYTGYYAAAPNGAMPPLAAVPQVPPGALAYQPVTPTVPQTAQPRSPVAVAMPR